ncbi:MAG: AprI/Inh family metalloprotease inhibitor [Devosia sp.]
MSLVRRAMAPSLIIASLGLSLAGCASSGVNVRNMGEPEQLNAVQTGNVSTTALPPIGPNGEVQSADPNAAQVGDPLGAPAGDMQTANADGSFDVLEPVGALPNSGARDLSGGLTVEKLLGGWTVISGANQCQLNLTQTSKSGTSRYRANSPSCSLKGLAIVASWQLSGSQVQLFDENGDMIATLILSGNRFIGTLSGGQGISMTG